MQLQILKTSLENIRDFRVQFLHENNFQFVCDKCHYYGWADTYLFLLNGIKAGYGAVWGTNKREDRDTIFEFFVSRPFRKLSNILFPSFIEASATTLIECQSNDVLLSSMLFEHAHNIHAEAILFEDHFETHLQIPGVVFYRKSTGDDNSADIGGYVLEQNGETVAEGGFMLNYNFPYADIYMDVKEPYRQRGFGSLIVQELKKEIYRMGRVPAARCNISNHASKATLLKAGLRPCGFRLKGEIKKGYQ